MNDEYFPSPLYQKVEHRLKRSGGGTLLDFVVTRRRTLIGWRTIAAELNDRTGADAAVTGETLRNWFNDRIQVEVEVRVA